MRKFKLLQCLAVLSLTSTTLMAQPANDQCASVVPDALANGSSLIWTGDNTGATITNDFVPGSTLANIGIPVVWHAFTTTACGVIKIEYCGSPSVFTDFFNAVTTSCPGTNVFVPTSNFNYTACGDGNPTMTFNNLAAGTYYFPVWTEAGTAAGPYTITVTATACGGGQPPANDDCAGAIELFPSPTCNPVPGTVANATQSIPAISCDGFTGVANDDVWYSFVATDVTHTITVQMQFASGFDATIDLRTGGCNGTNIDCSDVSGTNQTETLVATGLTIGQTYYVRTYNWASTLPAIPTFTICVLGPEPAGCDADAGTLTADATPVCLESGTATISATPDGNAVIPVGFETLYLLVQGLAELIVDTDPLPTFVAAAADLYTIRTFVYDPATFDPASEIIIGSTTASDVNDLLIQGGGSICASLDVIGAAISVEDCPCLADAGALTPIDAQVCLEIPGPTLIGATFDVPATVPSGYVVVHLLTQGAGATILDTSLTPDFLVSALGEYVIHSLVYNPATLDLSTLVFGITELASIDAQLVQGGGIVCGSLDPIGATISVNDCPECPAEAGTITADATPVCLDAGSADISATPDGNTVVPPGYELTYLLSDQATGLFVEAQSTPSFNVTVAGTYIIHAMVFDPATINVVIDNTTLISDIEASFIEGGGSTCASIDLTGAAITVQECVICDANAGALIADETPVCLVEGAANISATPDGNAVVPVGYETLFVLTRGVDLVIVNVGATPTFDVTTAGSYTIHTLIYDPATLDLSGVVFGETTGFEINALLIQGGGDICASLDVTGALFEVIECIVCDAEAGTLTADASPVCLVEGSAQIGATPGGDAIVPPGYQTAFALTEGPGLVIRALGAGPVFTVNAAGSYTIHTLIYDPLTLDPGLIEIDVTTGFDINGVLVQGGGTICGSLDVAGAPVQVNDCTPSNDDCVNAILVPIVLPSDCPGAAVQGDNTYATMDGGDATCDDPGSDLLDVWYTFNSGANTTVTIDYDPGTMEDWSIVISDGCNGTEFLCLIQPVGPIEFPTDADTDYIVRIYSNLTFGNGGQFSLCISGAVPTVVCDGGSVQTIGGLFAVEVCQDADADVIDLATTSTSAENYTYLLTDESNVIVAEIVGGSLDFNSAPLGVYRVWGLSHNGDLVGADPGLLATDVTSTGTCIDLSDNYLEVRVEICDGLSDLTESAWNLFPNPSNGDFSLRFAGNDDVTNVEVFDLEGRSVYQQRIAMVRGQSYPFELGGILAQGVYSMRLASAKGNAALRLVVR